jgi:hypothetical protein
MLVQEANSKTQVAGHCADCGLLVEQRIACVDGITHSTVDLCYACWVACQQRQATQQAGAADRRGKLCRQR